MCDVENPALLAVDDLEATGEPDLRQGRAQEFRAQQVATAQSLEQRQHGGGILQLHFADQ